MMDDSTVQTNPEPRQPHECEAQAEAEHRFGIALQVAFAGWSATILLAAFLIESVIR